MRIAGVASAAFVVTALAGCAESGSSDGASRGADVPVIPAHERLDCDLPAAIEYCGGATCHYDNAAQELASSLALWDRQAGRMPDEVHLSLVGVPATYHNVPDPERCPPEAELRIDPSDIDRSLMLKKLHGTHQCGAEMPKFPYPEWGTASNPGPQREGLVQCIRDWVALLVEDSKRTPRRLAR